MKKIIFLCCLATAGFGFQSCHNAHKDAKDTADSLNKTKDTTIKISKTGGAPLDKDDAKFATDAANGGMAEVELGKLALRKTYIASLRKFAEMMVADHGKANEELQAIARKKAIALPADVDNDYKRKIADLDKKQGEDFNKAYVDAMISGHKETLDMMDKEARHGKDADLKAFAEKNAPTVKAHLEAIKRIHNL
jgi:putative membrane protein